MLAACQSNTYKIKGEGDALIDGDTLFLTTDTENSLPMDTIVVKDGGFEIEGPVDSIAFCMIYNPKKTNVVLPFFLEQGNIRVNFSTKPGGSNVAGTPINNKWQSLNDSIADLTAQIEAIAIYLYSNELSDEEVTEQQTAMEKINNDFTSLVTQTAKDNIDNEFGYFLLIYFEGAIASETHLELINSLPEEMRGRKEMTKVSERLNAELSTAVGMTISGFEMDDINGKTVSVMDEVKTNKVTIIDFWASWCRPCREEMPNLVKIYADYKDKGLGIIGVSLDSDREAWKKGVSDLGITWTQLSDLNGWDNAAVRLYNVRSIPHIIITDSNGTIIAKNIRGAELASFIKGALE